MGFLDTVSDSLDQFRPASVIDVLSIAVVLYLAFLLLKGTTAMSLLRGMLIVIIGAVILVEALNLKEGDQVEIQLARRNVFEVTKAPGRRELIARLRKFRGRLPASFRFDRLEANERG